MEGAYFRFIDSVKQSAKQFRLIFNNYSDDEVRKAIVELRRVHNETKCEDLAIMETNMAIGVVQIPQYTNIMEVLLEERINKRRVSNGNKQIDKRYFCLTFTCPEKPSIEESESFFEGFFNKTAFAEYVYCLEHVSTNIHCHCCIVLDPLIQGLRPQKLFDKFQAWNNKQCQKWKMTRYDSSGQCHYASKTYAQSKNFIKYIAKAEPDKRVYQQTCLIRQYNDKIEKDNSFEDYELLSQHMNICPDELATDPDDAGLLEQGEED